MGRRGRYGLAVACTVALILQALILTLGPAPAGAGVAPTEGVAPEPTELPPPLLRSWSAPNPKDIDIGPDGNVYVLDAEARAVEVYTPTGSLVRRWEIAPPVDEFRDVSSLTVSSTGEVFVGEEGPRIQRFAADGQLLSTWGEDDPGGYYLRGIVATAEGHVITTDQGDVREYTADGVFVRSWDAEGITYPQDVDIDASGAVFVTGFDGITKLLPTGEVDPDWDRRGTPTSYPDGVAVAPDGHVFAADGVPPWRYTPSGRINEADADGMFVTTWGSIGPGELQFRGSSLAVGPDGVVYVADQGNDRIKAFARVPRPDLRIRELGHPSYTGNQLYNADAVLQQLTVDADAGEQRSFRVSLENDAPLPDEIAVQAPARGPGFTVAYQAAGVDITDQVVAGSYAVALASGARTTIDLTLTVPPELTEATAGALLVSARSTAMRDRVDAVGVGVDACALGCSSRPASQRRSVAFVAVGDANRIIPVDLARSAVGAPIRVGGAPEALAASPDGRTVFVVTETSGSVTPIDTATRTKRPRISIGGELSDLAVTPDSRTLVVTGSLGVSRVDLVTGVVADPIAVGRNGPVALSADGRTAFVSESGVLAVDLASGRYDSPARAGDYVIEMVASPDGRSVYAVSGTSRLWSRGISRFDSSSLDNLWGDWAGYPQDGIDLAVAPDSSRVFMTDLAEGEIGALRVYPVAGGRQRLLPVDSPVAVAVAADSVLVAGHRTGDLTPFDLETLQRRRAIRVGGQLTDLVVVPRRLASTGSSGAG